MVGVRSDGSKHLLTLELCDGESAAAWKGCLDDLVARGLRAPMLCIIDGNPGLRRAVGEVWPRVAVQRCCVHKLRNLERKAPKHVLAEIRDDFHRIVYAMSADTARIEYAAFGRRWGKRCPSVVTSLREGGDELLTFFRFPKAQWKTLRTTDENVKWRMAASGNRLGVGTGDPDRSVGHEAVSSTAQVALWRIRRAPLWGTRAPRPRYGRVVRSVPLWSSRSSWAVEGASVRRASDRRAPPALRSPALDRAAPSGCTRA